MTNPTQDSEPTQGHIVKAMLIGMAIEDAHNAICPLHETKKHFGQCLDCAYDCAYD